MKLPTAWAAEKVCADAQLLQDMSSSAFPPVDVASGPQSGFPEGTEVGISLPYNLAVSTCCWTKESCGVHQDASGPSPCTAVTVSIVA